MGYVTPAQLADSPRAQEIAQCATPENDNTVATELMDAVLRGNDTSSFDPADVAVAQLVLATVVAQIDDASQFIDGFLAKRYALPFQSAPPILTTWCRAIVRYKLNKDLISDERSSPIARDYRDATKFLAMIAAGTMSLGAGDPTGEAAGGNGPEFASGGRTFSRESLHDFVHPAR